MFRINIFAGFFILLTALLHRVRCAKPIDIYTQRVTATLKPDRKIETHYIPQQDPILYRRKRDEGTHEDPANQITPKPALRTRPWQYWDWMGDNRWRFHNGRWHKWVPAHFASDDYIPFLGPKRHEKPHVPRGARISGVQLIELLKSLVIGTGIKQGPKNMYRVHIKDKPWLDGSIPQLPREYVQPDDDYGYRYQNLASYVKKFPNDLHRGVVEQIGYWHYGFLGVADGYPFNKLPGEF